MSTAELARRVGISTRELERLFQRWLRSTPSAYYRRMRLERARALLRQTDTSITDVAVACGFGSIASFSRSYKACYGHAPSAGRFASAMTGSAASSHCRNFGPSCKVDVRQTANRPPPRALDSAALHLRQPK